MKLSENDYHKRDDHFHQDLALIQNAAKAIKIKAWRDVEVRLGHTVGHP